MKPFKWMFEEQNATEIEYKGKQVSALYRYDKKGKYRLKFTFVSTNWQYEQSNYFTFGWYSKQKIFLTIEKFKKGKKEISTDYF